MSTNKMVQDDSMEIRKINENEMKIALDLIW